MIGLADASRETVMRLNLSRRTGVYFIRNRINEKIYIGSASRNFSFRFRCHANELRYGTHPNRHLQGAWKQYGPKAFEWGVLEDCSPDDCIRCEQKWIDFFKPEYNHRMVAGSSRGEKHTDATKALIGNKNRGRIVGAETRAKIGAASLGRKHTEETRAKMRAWKHPKMSDAHKAKLVAINTGRKMTPEQRAAVSARFKGIPRTAEFKQYMSDKLTGRKAPWIAGIPMKQEVKNKIAKARTGLRNTPETIAKMCAAQRKWRAEKKERALCV